MKGYIERRLRRILSVLLAFMRASNRESQLSWEPRKTHPADLTKIRGVAKTQVGS